MDDWEMKAYRTLDDWEMKAYRTAEEYLVSRMDRESLGIFQMLVDRLDEAQEQLTIDFARVIFIAASLISSMDFKIKQLKSENQELRNEIRRLRG